MSVDIDDIALNEVLVSEESVDQGQVSSPRDLARYLQAQIGLGLFTEEMDLETLASKLSTFIGEWRWQDAEGDDRMLKIALAYFAVLGTITPKLTRHELRLVRRWYRNALREFGADETETRKMIAELVANSDEWKDEVIRGLGKD